MLIEDYRNLWFVELLIGLQLELAPLGYRVAVEELSLNASVDASPVDGLLALRVEGIVIATEPTEEMASVTSNPRRGRRKSRARTARGRRGGQ